MFEFLFKYPLEQFRQADWFFASGWSGPQLLAAIAASLLLLMVSVFFRRLNLWQKSLLFVLQGIADATLLLMLWQPTLRSQEVTPGENAVAVLLDTSRSMLYGESGNNRFEQMQSALEQSALLDKLAEEYTVDLQSVAAELTPLDLTDAPLHGSKSDLRSALSEVLQTTASAPLAGVVLVSDGADTSDVDADWWQQLSGYGVPIYSVGVGRSVLQEDLSLQGIVMRDSVTPNTRVNARVTVRHGRAGEVRLRIHDDQTLVYSALLTLPPDVNESSHVVVFNSGDAGIRDLRFELESDQQEINTVNNSQRRLLSVQDNKKRILYVEGEPRWEFKFIRRAVSESPEIEVVSLLQTSPNKFYRQGVRDGSELQDGFPLDQESLFSYDAIIIGSLEAAKLNEQQQRHLRDFVRVRGGALLMLAGPHGLAEGGWARSAVAQALPVSLSIAGGNQVGNSTRSYVRERARAQLTALGLQTDWLRFAVDDAANQLLWQELPELADVQHSGALKAGASALLEATVGDTRLPLLVRQRYGLGWSFVLATSGTWRWQMSLPAADQRHEQFWQGLLGELVAGALPRLAINTDRRNYYDEDAVTMTIDVRDETFQPDLSATLNVSLTGPEGLTGSLDDNTIRVEPTETPGRYRADFILPVSGEYSINVDAGRTTEPAEVGQRAQQWVLRQDERAEDFALAADNTFMARLASETGGQAVDLDKLDTLPALLRQSNALVMRDQLLPLWNLPAAFLLLLLCKLTEWIMRLRWKRI